jgi:hypothetical protein
MAFKVFPDPPLAPLAVAGQKTSERHEFAAMIGGAQGGETMFIALVKLGTGCSPPTGSDPRVLLSADGGAAVAVAKSPDAEAIRDAQGVDVGDATIDRHGDGVYRVRVFDPKPGSSWALQIENDDADAREFTWVVADNEDESRQPWIDFETDSFSFDTSTGDEDETDIQVFNRGTGPLRIDDSATVPPGPFGVTAPAQPLAPNACDSVNVTFTAPQVPGQSSAVYAPHTNDTTAGTSAGHIGRLALSGNALPRATEVPLFALDPAQLNIFRVDFKRGDLAAAIGALLDLPHPLGTLTFPPDQGAPPAAAMQSVVGNLRAAFPDPFYNQVTYFTAAGDTSAGTAELRNARRTGVKRATASPDVEGSISDDPSDASVTAPADAFAVARAKGGVTQPGFMVVQVVPPPIVDDFDASGPAHEAHPATITGKNLVLADGDRVFVSYSGSSRLDPSVSVSGECPITGTPTPTKVICIFPFIDQEVDVEVRLSRSDGAEVVAAEFQNDPL